MSQTIAEFLKPPGATLDERIEAEVLRAFCEAGGRFRDHAHWRLGGKDLCPCCSSPAGLARHLWDLTAVHGISKEIRDKVTTHIQAMSEEAADGA